MREAKHVVNQAQKTQHRCAPIQLFEASGSHFHEGVSHQPGRRPLAMLYENNMKIIVTKAGTDSVMAVTGCYF